MVNVKFDVASIQQGYFCANVCQDECALPKGDVRRNKEGEFKPRLPVRK